MANRTANTIKGGLFSDRFWPQIATGHVSKGLWSLLHMPMLQHCSVVTAQKTPETPIFTGLDPDTATSCAPEASVQYVLHRSRASVCRFTGHMTHVKQSTYDCRMYR